MLEMVRADAPLLVTVTVLTALATPVGWLPKARLAGEGVAVGGPLGLAAMTENPARARNIASNRQISSLLMVLL
jgi:hypothetical protein